MSIPSPAARGRRALLHHFDRRHPAPWEDLGLDPDRLYKLFRDPEELARAAPSFNNLQVLSRHVPVSADDHQPDITVGSTGTDAVFETPYLKNSMVFWSRDAIDAIQSGIISNGKNEPPSSDNGNTTRFPITFAENPREVANGKADRQCAANQSDAMQCFPRIQAVPRC